MRRFILTGGWGVVAALCLPFPAGVQANTLPSARWTETVTIHAATTTDEALGQDDDAPEAIGDTLSTANYVMKGYVAFGQAGPPYVTVYASGLLPRLLNSTFTVSSQSAINFDLMIVQIHTPPVAVDFVPILVQSQGVLFGNPSCEIIYICGSATAQASMVVTQNGTEIFNNTASLHVSSDPSKESSLDTSKPVSIRPGVNLHGSVTALATIAVSGWGYAAVARASLGPKFEITDALIPGTEVPYTDFFKIEYSPGYWALGDPTPVLPTTWGRIKTLYLNP